MILLLLGPPGAGKGTQSRVLCKRFGIPVISTGEILRDAARKGTPFGIRAKSFTDRGELVPDDLMIEVVLHRLRELDCEGGFLLDGFPRTVLQAEALDRFLDERGLRPDAVLHLVVDREELVRRLSGRRVCSRCGENYHLISKPPRHPGVCDLDGAPLIQRDDDKPETIRQRLIVSERDTAPVADYYRDQGLLTTINGNVPPERVTAAMLAAIPGGLEESAHPLRLEQSQAGPPAPQR
jgi:adenylate kinase